MDLILRYDIYDIRAWRYYICFYLIEVKINLPGFFWRFYLFIHERHTERAETQAEGEAGSSRSRKPNVGLDPRTLGSRPELKAEAQPLSHPGVPWLSNCYSWFRGKGPLEPWFTLALSPVSSLAAPFHLRDIINPTLSQGFNPFC